ncbi:MAG: S9 family peptidase [Elusimicrobiota bacterium]
MARRLRISRLSFSFRRSSGARAHRLAAAFIFNASLNAFARKPYSAKRLASIQDITEAVLSGDGRRIAFVSDASGALEAWTSLISNGRVDQISALKEQVVDIHFSPDGSKLVFTADFGGNERPNIYVVPAEGGYVSDIAVSTMAEMSPRFSADGRNVAYLADADRSFSFQLMVMNLKTKQSRQLTREPISLSFPVWSPDSRTIAVTRTGDNRKGSLLLVDVLSGRRRVVNPPVANGILIAQQFDPADANLLCLARNKSGFLELYLLNLASLKGHFIGPDRWDISQAIFHPKLGIVYSRNEGGAFALYRMRSPVSSPETLLPRGGNIEEFSADAVGNKIAYLWSDSRYPPGVWLLDTASLRKAEIVGTPAARGVKPDVLSRARMFVYPSFDGRMIHSLFLDPVNKRLGNPPPAVVFVHGGPDWQIFDEFDPLRQALAEAGIAVIAPNFRGSTGFGVGFERANYKDWGGGDLRDIIKGVEFLAGQRKIDPRRVGIMGGSFGGYMTLFALAKNKGEWAAGVDAYGMPDLTLDYNLTKDQFADWYKSQIGTPQTDPKIFHDRSAINFVNNLKAPLLIFQGANDTDVPAAESRLIYDRLVKMGRPVALVMYPDEGHGLDVEDELFTKLKNRVDSYRKIVDFFIRYLSGAR